MYERPAVRSVRPCIRIPGQRHPLQGVQHVGQPGEAAFIPLGSPRRTFFRTVRIVTARLGCLAILGVALSLAGCGGDDETAQLSEGDVRECLAGEQIVVRAPDAKVPEAPQYAPLYLDTAPDFIAYAKDGTAVDVVVLGSAERAKRTAAHAKGTLESLGGTFAAASNRVLQDENVVVVFHRDPTAASRTAVRACLAD